MLQERAATATRHDEGADAFEIDLLPGAAAAATTRAHAQGTLLLDREGRLVGVDLRKDARVNAVIMLGPHEAVSRQVPGRLELLLGDRGAPQRVRILGASSVLNLR